MNTPKYRRQRRKGSGRDRAFVQLDGERVYLGEYGTAESQEQYHRLLAERATGVPTKRVGSPREESDFTVVELVDRYREHLDETVSRPANYKAAFRDLTKLYGSMRVVDFGAAELVTLQRAMSDRAWSPQYVNKNVARIRRMFKWGIPRELAPAPVYAELQALDGLRVRRSADDRVKPAPMDHVLAVKSHVSRQVWAMVSLQLHTGARPGEICAMRAVDIDMSSNPWEYRPTEHKTQHLGKDRVIYLGSKAQSIIRPFLANRAVSAPLFSPREVVAEYHRVRAENRVTPASCGNRPGSNRQSAPKRSPRDAYTTNSYAVAIRRTCKRLDIPVWSPNQLRHNYATHVRAEHGIDAAATLLGHARVETTQIYAELAHEKAKSIARQIG